MYTNWINNLWKLYEHTQKTQKNQRNFLNLQLHLAYRFLKMFVLIRHIFCKCLVKIICYLTQKSFTFVIFFSDIGQCFRPFDKPYLHQTFTECVSNQCTHFDVSICQMWLQVMQRLLILFRFLGIFIHYRQICMPEVLYLHQTFTDCVSH